MKEWGHGLLLDLEDLHRLVDTIARHDPDALPALWYGMSNLSVATAEAGLHLGDDRLTGAVTKPIRPYLKEKVRMAVERVRAQSLAERDYIMGYAPKRILDAWWEAAWEIESKTYSVSIDVANTYYPSAPYRGERGKRHPTDEGSHLGGSSSVKNFEQTAGPDTKKVVGVKLRSDTIALLKGHYGDQWVDKLGARIDEVARTAT